MDPNIDNLKNGCLLVATPALDDPFLTQTVILICKHDNNEGSFGLVINKLFPETMEKLTGKELHKDFPVYYGGPMPEGGLMLHCDASIFSGEEISNGIYMGTKESYSKLEGLILQKDSNQNKAKIFGGYTGWAQGGIEEEIKQGFWLIRESTIDLVFNTGPDIILDLLLNPEIMEPENTQEQDIEIPKDIQDDANLEFPPAKLNRDEHTETEFEILETRLNYDIDSRRNGYIRGRIVERAKNNKK